MATRRKDKKIRDKEATIKRLIESVGEIVRTEGFHEVGVNKIARLAENDKGVIRYHFGGLSNLLRAYIRERDYWPPFFERYKIDGTADQSEVREMFTALMQENLKQFYEDKEMQKIILWQISEANPLLRQISEEREVEGEKLLNLVNPTFLTTGISFKAVIALLLGGSYFAVLQSQSIKSRVCGIDVNWERDFAIMQKTIGQIISWAWEKANAENKSTDIPMSYELDKLEDLAERMLKRGDNIGQLSPELELETKKVERALSGHLLALTNETQIVTFLHVYIGRLVRLCNLFFDEQREENPNAQVMLELMEALRRPVSVYIPENIGLPLLFRSREAAAFKILWSFIQKPLQEKGFEERFIDIVYTPVKHFVSARQEMKWSDFKYVKRYLAVLQEHTEGEFTLDSLLETLVGVGFNYTRFSTYFTSRILEKIRSGEFGEAKFVLEEYKSRLLQISIYTKRDFDRHKPPILEELEKWIKGELARVKARGLGSNPMKLISRFKGVQLAFWKKLQYDHGVYEEDNLDVYSEKIAYNYSTKSQDDLSAASIKSKFYPKDRAIYKLIEKMLMAMLEDIRKFL